MSKYLRVALLTVKVILDVIPAFFSFFGIPKDQSLFEEWKRVIPIERKALNPKSLV
jgi:hypothetical protein